MMNEATLTKMTNEELMYKIASIVEAMDEDMTDLDNACIELSESKRHPYRSDLEYTSRIGKALWEICFCAKQLKMSADLAVD